MKAGSPGKSRDTVNQVAVNRGSVEYQSKFGYLYKSTYFVNLHQSLFSKLYQSTYFVNLNRSIFGNLYQSTYILWFIDINFSNYKDLGELTNWMARSRMESASEYM